MCQFKANLLLSPSPWMGEGWGGGGKNLFRRAYAWNFATLPQTPSHQGRGLYVTPYPKEEAQG